jgi:pre-rRNA-processing protein TSR1
MSHKAGDFKQQNKGHKTKFRTKGSIAGEAQGRMPSIKTTHASKKDHRQDRRNKANQLRKARREEAQQERIKSHAPFFIAIIDLCNAGNEQAISLFDQLAPNEVHMHGACNNKHANIYVSRLKKSVTLSVAHRDVFSALELAKVADMVLFVLTAGARPDATGTSIMTAMSLQGIPTIAHVIVSLETLSAKKRADEKRILSKLAHNSFAETKIHTLEKPSDLEALPWALLNQKHHAVRWRQARSQLFADRVEFLPDEDGTTGTLKVTGYVRSRAWNVNNLVYLPGFGAFQVSSLQSETDPLLAKKHSADEMTRVVQPDPEQQDSLQMEVPIDPLAAEQTWPTEEELQNADLEERIRRSKLKQEREGKFVLAPKGTSSYQAAWIADDEHGSEHGSDGMAHGSDENESGDDDDHGDEASDENEDIWTKLDQSKLINEHHDDDGEEHDLELVPRKEGDHIDKDKAYDDAMNVEFAFLSRAASC